MYNFNVRSHRLAHDLHFLNYRLTLSPEAGKEQAGKFTKFSPNGKGNKSS